MLLIEQDNKHNLSTLSYNLVQKGVREINISRTVEPLSLKIEIYSKELVTLSSLVETLMRLGLEVVDAVTKLSEQTYVHSLQLRVRDTEQVTEISNKMLENIKIALRSIWSGTLDDDDFNSTMIDCDIDCRQAALLRVYAKYLKQVGFDVPICDIIKALRRNSKITHLLLSLFSTKFEGTRPILEEHVETLTNGVKLAIADVPIILEERVLYAYLDLILATKRTNYFQLKSLVDLEQAGSLDRSDLYMSLKIAIAEVKSFDVPLPKPFVEVFVYSTAFEAVHLRGGKIARGGLRWSERLEDFRTEILGLMKAQLSKNSIIVPTGAKGGFIVKKAGPQDKGYLEEGIRCYKMFLKALLEITDNVVESQVVAPEGIVRYDGDDPYLVVAADKGTASFSDYANQISLERNFWLGDAFASGGSAGYDHKKMAITARGVWISVMEHFQYLGIDAEKPFTVAGIGGMSGDLFGNGMLLSKNIKLVAVFNHSHIFLDPNPNLETSYQERVRLFKLKHAGWQDYNTSLISKGGGVYSRSEKSIKISSEVQSVLEISEDTLSANELIRAILKAPVDLLWNGGIGTYVKASSQTNADAYDKDNDDVRVNGCELRCKVVGEGGNLGFTQLGRIEYARAGGRVNTDALDNSAGVDCSDHEVNIKIAFVPILKDGVLNISERNALLAQMEEEVAALVLKDNMKQTQIVSIEAFNAIKRLKSHESLIKFLESAGELNRSSEFLPTEVNFKLLEEEGKGLTRPEIAVLIAYAKNSIASLLKGRGMFSTSGFDSYLMSYFPVLMQEKFKKYILNHALRDELIATVLSNKFVNTMGCTCFHNMMKEYGYSASYILWAFLAAQEITQVDYLWMDLERACKDASDRLSGFVQIQNCVYKMMDWLLRYHPYDLADIEKVVVYYKENIATLKSNGLDGSGGNSQQICLDLSKGLEISLISDKTRMPVLSVLKIFESCSDEMYFDTILWEIGRLSDNSHNELDCCALKILRREVEELRMALVETLALRSDHGTVTRHHDLDSDEYKVFKSNVMEISSSGSEQLHTRIARIIIAIQHLRKIVDGEKRT